MVCPHNAWTPEQDYVLGEPKLEEHLDLLNLFTLSKKEFNDKFAGTALLRAKRNGMLRNAAVVLGNQRYQPALPLLREAAMKETDEAVIDACNWAIQSIEAKPASD